jgi:hypothetical protein
MKLALPTRDDSEIIASTISNNEHFLLFVNHLNSLYESPHDNFEEICETKTEMFDMFLELAMLPPHHDDDIDEYRDYFCFSLLDT